MDLVLLLNLYSWYVEGWILGVEEGLFGTFLIKRTLTFHGKQRKNELLQAGPAGARNFSKGGNSIPRLFFQN